MSLWGDTDAADECEGCGRALDGADLCPRCDYPMEEDDEGWMTHGGDNSLWDTTDDEEAKP